MSVKGALAKFKKTILPPSIWIAGRECMLDIQRIDDSVEFLFSRDILGITKEQREAGIENTRIREEGAIFSRIFEDKIQDDTKLSLEPIEYPIVKKGLLNYLEESRGELVAAVRDGDESRMAELDRRVRNLTILIQRIIRINDVVAKTKKSSVPPTHTPKRIQELIRKFGILLLSAEREDIDSGISKENEEKVIQTLDRVVNRDETFKDTVKDADKDALDLFEIGLDGMEPFKRAYLYIYLGNYLDMIKKKLGKSSLPSKVRFALLNRIDKKEDGSERGIASQIDELFNRLLKLKMEVKETVKKLKDSHDEIVQTTEPSLKGDADEITKKLIDKIELLEKNKEDIDELLKKCQAAPTGGAEDPRITALTLQFAALQEKVDKGAAVAAATAADLATAREELKSARDSIEGRISEIAGLQGQIQEARVAAAASLQKTTDLEERVKHLNEIAEEAGKKAGDSPEALEAARVSREHADAAAVVAAAAAAAATAANASLQALQGEMKNARGDILESKKEIDELKTKVNALERKENVAAVEAAASAADAKEQARQAALSAAGAAANAKATGNSAAAAAAAATASEAARLAAAASASEAERTATAAEADRRAALEAAAEEAKRVQAEKDAEAAAAAALASQKAAEAEAAAAAERERIAEEEQKAAAEAAAAAAAAAERAAEEEKAAAEAAAAERAAEEERAAAAERAAAEETAAAEERVRVEAEAAAAAERARKEAEAAADLAEEEAKAAAEEAKRVQDEADAAAAEEAKRIKHEADAAAAEEERKRSMRNALLASAAAAAADAPEEPVEDKKEDPAFIQYLKNVLFNSEYSLPGVISTEKEKELAELMEQFKEDVERKSVIARLVRKSASRLRSDSRNKCVKKTILTSIKGTSAKQNTIQLNSYLAKYYSASPFCISESSAGDLTTSGIYVYNDFIKIIQGFINRRKQGGLSLEISHIPGFILKNNIVEVDKDGTKISTNGKFTHYNFVDYKKQGINPIKPYELLSEETLKEWYTGKQNNSIPCEVRNEDFVNLLIYMLYFKNIYPNIETLSESHKSLLYAISKLSDELDLHDCPYPKRIISLPSKSGTITTNEYMRAHYTLTPFCIIFEKGTDYYPLNILSGFIEQTIARVGESEITKIGIPGFTKQRDGKTGMVKVILGDNNVETHKKEYEDELKLINYMDEVEKYPWCKSKAVEESSAVEGISAALQEIEELEQHDPDLEAEVSQLDASYNPELCKSPLNFRGKGFDDFTQEEITLWRNAKMNCLDELKRQLDHLYGKGYDKIDKQVTKYFYEKRTTEQNLTSFPAKFTSKEKESIAEDSSILFKRVPVRPLIEKTYTPALEKREPAIKDFPSFFKKSFSSVSTPDDLHEKIRIISSTYIDGLNEWRELRKNTLSSYIATLQKLKPNAPDTLTKTKIDNYINYYKDQITNLDKRIANSEKPNWNERLFIQKKVVSNAPNLSSKSVIGGNYTRRKRHAVSKNTTYKKIVHIAGTSKRKHSVRKTKKKYSSSK